MAAPAEGPELSRTTTRVVLFGLLTGVFMSALDMTIMATATRTVADSLHGLTAQAWITSAYLMTMTISATIREKKTATTREHPTPADHGAPVTDG
ncbi:hypothetical protein [Frankia sp. CcWB3]